MARTYDLLIRARGDSKQAQAAMAGAGRSVADLKQSVANFGRGVRNVGMGLTAAITLPLLLAARIGIDELNEAQKATAQTRAVIASTGGAAGLSTFQITKFATALSRMSGIDDQVIQGGENILLTFNKIGKKDGTFNRATRAALDLSVAFGKDMTSSSVMVGKALQDPVKGVAALSRVGVSFTAGQKAVIKQLVKTGQTAKAQKLILKELETQVGGSAKAFGTTAAGAVGKLKEQFAGIAARMVTMLLPAFQKLAGWLERGMNWFEGLSGSTQKWIGIVTLVGGVLGPVLVVLGSLAVAIAAIGGTALLVGGAIAALVAGFIVAYKRSTTFRKIVNQLAAALRTYVRVVVTVYGAIGTLAARVATAITRSNAFKSALGFLVTAVRNSVQVFVTIYGAIATMAERMQTAINKSQTLRAWIDNVKASASLAATAIGLAASAAGTLGSKALSAAGHLTKSLKPALDIIRAVGGSSFSTMLSVLRSVDSTIAAVIRKVTDLIQKVEKVIQRIKDIPSIPGLGGPGRSPNDSSGRPGSGSRSRSIGGASRAKGGAPAAAPAMAMRSRSGPTVVQNIYPQSQDVEAIARRVAFLIGTGKVTLKAGMA